jgi:hypothetical protein
VSGENKITRLKRVIERDRTAVAMACASIRQALVAREWMREGRGSYSWDDDRWMAEFGVALDEIYLSLAQLRAIASDLTDSPVTQTEVDAARASLKIVPPQLVPAPHQAAERRGEGE